MYLVDLGASPTVALLALGLALAAGSALNALVASYGDRFGRRRSMVLFGGLMAAAGLLLAASPGLAVALTALALGAMSPSGSEVGPALAVELSVVAQLAPPERRTRAFATYNLLGSFGAAAGALASVLYTAGAFGPTGAVAALRPAFLLYAGLGLLAALLSSRLPAEIEHRSPEPTSTLAPESRRRVVRLSALFGVDSAAGGLVVQSFVALWFALTFPESAPILGAVFFAAGVLSALSFIVAARLGERIGLVETMVYTHLPSNILLMIVPLAPSFAGALGLYLARMSLSQMDVPTRQAYLAGIVAPSERTSANAWTSLSRNLGQASGPFAASWLATVAGLASPFFVAGGLKAAYDIAVLRSFRHIRPDST